MSEIEGAAFGIMSGVITILGVLIGLSVTGVKSIASMGIVIVGVADAFSDAAGMYVSEESEGMHKFWELFRSAAFTFAGKISMLVVLLVPVLLLNLWTGVLVSAAVGITIVAGLGLFIGRKKHLPGKIKMAVKYALIAMAIAIISYYIGGFAQNFFGI